MQYSRATAPKLYGAMAIARDFEAVRHEPCEIYSFVCTDDVKGHSRLRRHLAECGLQWVGTFETTQDNAFRERVAFLLGRVISGTVFRVGWCATRDILPEVIYDPEMDYPE